MSDFYEITIEERAERLRGLALEALKAWNLADCQLKLIKIRENAVFRVQNSTGLDAAIRIHRFGYHSDGALESELSWIAALYRDGIEVPQIIPANDGRLFVTQNVADVPEPRQVDMVNWIDGVPLGSIEEGLSAAVTDISATFRQVGSLAARLHNHAARWLPPPGFTRHAWDADGLTGEEPLWGRFWEFDGLDAEQKALILRARDTARRDLLRAHDGGLGYGLIHADFNFDNFLLRNGKVMALDFDDCGNGWHLFDLATITILFLGTDQYDAVHGAVVEGYRQERELTDETLSLMPLFYLLRVFTYLGWVHTRSETKSAQEIAPMVVEMTCNQAEEYLKVNA